MGTLARPTASRAARPTPSVRPYLASPRLPPTRPSGRAQMWAAAAPCAAGAVDWERREGGWGGWGRGRRLPPRDKNALSPPRTRHPFPSSPFQGRNGCLRLRELARGRVVRGPGRGGRGGGHDATLEASLEIDQKRFQVGVQNRLRWVTVDCGDGKVCERPRGPNGARAKRAERVRRTGVGLGQRGVRPHRVCRRQEFREADAAHDCVVRDGFGLRGCEGGRRGAAKFKRIPKRSNFSARALFTLTLSPQKSKHSPSSTAAKACTKSLQRGGLGGGQGSLLRTQVCGFFTPFHALLRIAPVADDRHQCIQQGRGAQKGGDGGRAVGDPDGQQHRSRRGRGAQAFLVRRSCGNSGLCESLRCRLRRKRRPTRAG